VRKIFIDCGAHNGCSVRMFRKIINNPNEHQSLNQLHNLTKKDVGEFEIFSFEANPAFKELLEAIPGVTVFSKGVSAVDGTATFYETIVGKIGSAASTFNATKRDWNVDQGHKGHKEIQVETIDLSNWIKTTFDKTDFIMLKLDVEGSEYEILQKMLDDNTLDYINVLAIEYHWHKCGVSEEEHNRIVKEVAAKVKYINDTWDATGH
jgi:FkbM family methyltransferase